MNEPDVWFERWANEMCLGETDWCLQNVWFFLLLFWNWNCRLKSMSENISSCVSPVSRLCIEKEAVVSIPAVTNHPTRGQINTILWRLANGGWQGFLAGCWERLLQRLSTYNQHWPNPTLRPIRQHGHVCLSNQIIKMSISQVWIPYVYTHKAHWPLK